MILESSIANDIVKKTKTIFGTRIFIANKSGEILTEGWHHKNLKIEYFDSVFLKGNPIEVREKDKKIILAPIFYNKKVIGVFGITLTSKKEKSYVSLIQSLSEVLIYEKGIIENLYSTTETINEFIADLFSSQSAINSFKEAQVQAEILGLGLRENQACILIRINSLKEGFEKEHQGSFEEERSGLFKEYLTEIISQIKNIFPREEKNIIGYLKDNLFLLIREIKGNCENKKFSNSILRTSANLIFDELNKGFKNKVTIGIGQFYPGLFGLRKSYNDAKMALDIGSKIWGLNKTYHILDIGMFISLGETNFERKKELALQIFSPLFDKNDLLKTVETFFECGMNLTQASKKLHLHRNTLVYRLSKIKKLLGLDPRSFYDAFQIKIGLIFTKDSRLSGESVKKLSFKR